MSTRGFIGFRYQGQDLLQYNHSDSYPTWLGKTMTEVARSLNLDIAKSYVLTVAKVDIEAKPSKAQKAQLAVLGLVGGTGRGDPGTFYDYLRPFQGDLSWFVDNKVPFWPDSGNLPLDSSCEWGYIVNLDTEALEVYTSHWNLSYYLKMKAAGRYATTPVADSEDQAANLVASIPLAELQELPKWAMDQWLARVERLH